MFIRRGAFIKLSRRYPVIWDFGRWMMKLGKTAYSFYTHNEIRPSGWIKRQLMIQADGLAGNLDKVWPDVRESKWIGGDKEGWERVPYWLDGFIPLAFLLEDEDKIGRAKKYIDGILSRQEEDGWICPCEKQARKVYDLWAALLIGKVLVMYADLSADDRIPEAVYRIFKQLDEFTRSTTLNNWAMYRWYEGLIPLFWLYEHFPEEWILKLAKRFSEQGFDYVKLFEHYEDKQAERVWTYSTHVVNLAMAIKQDALFTRLYGGDPDAFAKKMLDTLFKYHGMAVGHFTGDECIAGDSPVQGAELCSIVEAMYSYEQLLSVSGNPMWGDYLERLAFNALPATLSDDMWTHQYDQQTNQICCERQPEDHVIFMTNGREANLFGLEPEFGCCTANMGQGFPKLMMSAFLHSENEVFSAVFVPGTVETTIGGAGVKITLDTAYPFKRKLYYSVDCEKAAEFSLRIRIPSWAVRTEVSGIDGGYSSESGSILIKRSWEGKTEFTVEFTFECTFKERPRDMAVLWRGPLMYSVPVNFEKRMHEYVKNGVERKFPYCDYELIPTSAWNYAFKAEGEAEVQENGPGAVPFSAAEPAVTIRCPMVRVDWCEENKSAKIEPESRAPLSGAEVVTLIPYGAAKLRMTEMPVI